MSIKTVETFTLTFNLFNELLKPAVQFQPYLPYPLNIIQWLSIHAKCEVYNRWSSDQCDQKNYLKLNIVNIVIKHTVWKCCVSENIVWSSTLYLIIKLYCTSHSHLSKLLQKAILQGLCWGCMSLCSNLWGMNYNLMKTPFFPFFFFFAAVKM